jgi:hypothetical protein
MKPLSCLGILAFLTLFACKNDDPKPRYTIEGRILDGTTGSSDIYNNSTIEIEATAGDGLKKKRAILGTTTTNDTGWFSITYDETDVTGADQQIHIFSQFFQIDGLPVNQDIKRRFYESSKGTINLNLKSKTQLNIGDTLFLAYRKYESGNDLQVDTITQTFNGFYRSIRTPTGKLNIVWGIGTKKFKYDGVNAGSLDGNVYYAPVTGDPVVDEVTLEY